MADTLDRLAATIAVRRAAPPDSSYVASLLAKGTPKIAQKLGEEAVETVIAAMQGDPKAITSEAADLLFHLMVLLDAAQVPLSDVLAELERREGVSGIEEKARRLPASDLSAQGQCPGIDPPSFITPGKGAEAPIPTSGIALGRKPGARPRIRKG